MAHSVAPKTHIYKKLNIIPYNLGIPSVRKKRKKANQDPFRIVKFKISRIIDRLFCHSVFLR